MKHKFLLALSLLALICALPVLALDRYAGEINVSSSLTTVSNTTATATTGTPLKLREGQTLSVMPVFSGGVGTSNVVYGFALSFDKGTNYSTTLPLTVTIAANGTNTVKGVGQFTAAQLQDATHIKLISVSTTQTNNITTANVFYGFTY